MSDLKSEISSRMQSEHQFRLRWNDHQRTLVGIFEELLDGNILLDCTLAAEGQCLKAHKVVLCACSPYFQLLLSQHTDKHPIVILKDVKFQELQAMIDYMYRGEVSIPQDQLGPLLHAAESLQIRGLGGTAAQSESDSLEKTLLFDKSVKEKDCVTSPKNSLRPRKLDTTEEILSKSQIAAIRKNNMSPIPHKRMRHRVADSCDEKNVTSAQETVSQNISVADVSVIPLTNLTGSNNTNFGKLSDWPPATIEEVHLADNIPSVEPLSFDETMDNSCGNQNWDNSRINSSPVESNHSTAREPPTASVQQFSTPELILIPKTECIEVEEESLPDAIIERVEETEAAGSSQTGGAAFIPWLEKIDSVTSDSLGQNMTADYRTSQDSMLSSRRRSWAWNYFTRESNILRCSICMKELKYHASKKTSGMIRHLRTHNLMPDFEQCSEIIQ